MVTIIKTKYKVVPTKDYVLVDPETLPAGTARIVLAHDSLSGANIQAGDLWFCDLGKAIMSDLPLVSGNGKLVAIPVSALICRLLQE